MSNHLYGLSEWARAYGMGRGENRRKQMIGSGRASRLFGCHVSEISFLLGQRMVIFKAPDIQWPQVVDFENRLMAHVDGMVESEVLLFRLAESMSAIIVHEKGNESFGANGFRWTYFYGTEGLS